MYRFRSATEKETPSTFGKRPTTQVSGEANQLEAIAMSKRLSEIPGSGFGLGSKESPAKHGCLIGGLREHMSVYDRRSQQTTVCLTAGISSSSQRTKRVLFFGGYLHSAPLLVHLWQRGICFPHLRLACAQAPHALEAVLLLIVVETDVFVGTIERRIYQLPIFVEWLSIRDAYHLRTLSVCD